MDDFQIPENWDRKDDNGNFSRYVYLIDSKDYDNQHILKYSKFKGEESYDSVITDGTQDELIRINNIVTIRMQMSETIIRNNYYNYLDNKINSYKNANEQKEE